MQQGDPPAGVAGAVVDDALDILGDVLVWKLEPARWDAVAKIVARLEAAVQADDQPAFHEATVDLELASPTRVTRLGTVPTEPAPEPVRQIANRLVHTLTSRRTSR